MGGDRTTAGPSPPSVMHADNEGDGRGPEDGFARSTVPALTVTSLLTIAPTLLTAEHL